SLQTMPPATPSRTSATASSPLTSQRPAAARRSRTIAFNSSFWPIASSLRGADRSLHVNCRVVDLLERFRVPQLDVDESALLADDVEQRHAPELIALPYDVEVLAGGHSDCALVDVEGPLRGLVLRERGIHLLAHRKRRGLDALVCCACRRARRGDVP